MEAIWIGIDVCKARLDYCSGSTGTPASVPNTAQGHARLIRHLQQLPVAGIVVESTGAYHLRIVGALQRAGLPVSVLTPQWIKTYRESFGRGAKTDPRDAVLLARYGEERRPRPSRVVSPTDEVLRELVSRRDDLVTQITAEKNRLGVARHPMVRRHIEAAIEDLTARKVALEGDLRELIARDAHLTERQAQLRTVPGIGWVTSVVLLAYLPELGELDRSQIAALAGLAPYTRQSGNEDKVRFCHGGRAPVRRAMYLAAVTCTTNKRVQRTVYWDQYRQLEPSKGAKRALVAVARRMLVLVNAMVRDGLTWSETEVGQGLHPRPSSQPVALAA